MAQVFAYDGITPVIDPSAFVHPAAVLIGDVIVGPNCYVGPGAVLRGDFGRITMGEGANLQETCVVHAFPNLEVVIEAEGHVGHGAILHGCRIGRNALIGMNAVVMDEAVIGENAVVAALAFVRAQAEIPAGMLAVGAPARVVRALSAQEIEWKRQGTGVYRRLAAEAREKLVATEPLAAPEPGRPRMRAPAYDPLFLERLKFGDG